MICRIVPALPVHVGIIAGQLTDDERARFKGMGRDARRVIRGFFRQSSYRRTALLDERPAAIWGITGTLASSSGILWLRLSAVARKRPRLVVEECRAELARMLDVRREVVAYIHEDDAVAQRFAEFFGFQLSAPMWLDGVEFIACRGVISRGI
jgi:hypothetical protein